ncbi:hypothetical protein ACQ4PT_061176 [Festuca glaucescens]
MEGVAAGGGPGAAAGVGETTVADDDPGTTEGGQGRAGDGSQGVVVERSSADGDPGTMKGGKGGAAGSGAAVERSSADGDPGTMKGSKVGAAGSGAAVERSSADGDPSTMKGGKGGAAGSGDGAAAGSSDGATAGSASDLVESVVVQYPPRYLEVAHVHYYDNVLKTFPQIKSDQELMSMFEKHCKTKMVQMFFAYCDPSEPYDPITEYEHIGIDEHVGTDEDSYLCNPIPENEHVGIDEENMYLEKEPTCLNVVLFPDKEKDKDYAAADGSEDGSEDESEDESKAESKDESNDETELEEEEELHEANHAPNIEYDKEDPSMTKGSTYPNMDEFKLALSQHAVKHQFDFNTEKSTPYRFRGYCKRRDEDNCPWRIHASTTDNMCTVVVIV